MVLQEKQGLRENDASMEVASDKERMILRDQVAADAPIPKAIEKDSGDTIPSTIYRDWAEVISQSKK